MSLPTRREKLLEEIEWNREQLAKVERDRARAPYLLWALLLTVPAGFFFEWLGVVVVLVVVFATYGCALYLGEGHRGAYRAKLDELERDLSKL